MWIKEVSIESTASKKAVWKLYGDVHNWNKWDKTVEYSDVNGTFDLGVKGILKPVGGPEIKFIVSKLKLLCDYTISAKLPLAKLNFVHEIKETDYGIRLTHGIEIRGLTSLIFGALLGEKIIKDLPEILNNLVTMAIDGSR